MDKTTCPQCDGRGTYDYFAVGMRYSVRCDNCDGTGYAYPEPMTLAYDSCDVDECGEDAIDTCAVCGVGMCGMHRIVTASGAAFCPDCNEADDD